MRFGDHSKSILKLMSAFVVSITAIDLAAAKSDAHRNVRPTVSAVSLNPLRPIVGTKFPNTPSEGEAPVQASAWTLDSKYEPTGYVELLPYIFASPDQKESGSCL